MIKKLLKLNIGKYFIISCLASVIDFAISYLSFLISKFFSMAVPFFVTCFIRRKLLGVKNNKEK